MHTQVYTFTINIPSIDDFALDYPQYGNFARNEGHSLFERITTPMAFIKARMATELGLPAISGVSSMIEPFLIENDRRKGFYKQFSGAVICTLMQANGFRKTGIKKSVQRVGFNKGEVYKLVEA